MVARHPLYKDVTPSVFLRHTRSSTFDSELDFARSGSLQSCTTRLIVYGNHRRHEYAVQIQLPIIFAKDNFQLHGTCHLHLAYSSLRLWGVRRGDKAQDREI